MLVAVYAFSVFDEEGEAFSVLDEEGEAFSVFDEEGEAFSDAALGGGDSSLFGFAAGMLFAARFVAAFLLAVVI